MFSWLHRRKYKSQVLAEVMVIILHPDKNLIKFMRYYFPNSFKAIQRGCDERQDVVELATIIANAILVSMIDNFKDERRSAILKELLTWARTPNAIEEFSLQPELNTTSDAFIARLKWAIHYLVKKRYENGLDQYYVDYTYSEIFGALQGEASEERSANRIRLITNDALDQSKI